MAHGFTGIVMFFGDVRIGIISFKICTSTTAVVVKVGGCWSCSCHVGHDHVGHGHVSTRRSKKLSVVPDLRVLLRHRDTAPNILSAV